MEEDSREILSPLLEKPLIQKQFEYLEKVVEEAQKRVDYTVAHDSDLLKAISVVERFLRKRHRVCYGGQAINALLPKQRQFYDQNLTVPDYDFFSPSVDADVDELIATLEKEGFTDVSKRGGVHEGTMKIYVNYIAVADISEMHPQLFRIIQKRAKVINGIYYCDPDFLRMLMYLELSRPRGEVSRWKKVYERLILLNESFPSSPCEEEIITESIPREDRAIVLDFCVKHKRVVVAPEFIELYEKQQGKKHFETLVKRGGPVLFFSHQASVDADDIKDMLSKDLGPIKIHKHAALTDQLFSYYAVKRVRDSMPIALIFQEDACHSYTVLRLDEGSEIRLATPDLYLHLYYSLLLFGKKEKAFFQTPIECLINKLYTVLKIARTKPTSFLPAFGLRCSGRQKGISTLLRERVERAEVAKNKAKTNSKTRKIRKGLLQDQSS